MIKKLKEILGILCVVVMISLAFSAEVNVLANEDKDGENTLPTVKILYPKNEDVVNGVVWINGTAYAADPNLTIERVEIKMVRMGDEVEWSVDPTTNWNWSSEWIVANGTANWSYAWNVTNLLAGPYTIFARAWDGNNYSECAEVPVYVKRIHFWGATISGLPPEMVYALLIGMSVVIIISIIFIFLTKKSKK